jgi:hypothetical protein
VKKGVDQKNTQARKSKKENYKQKRWGRPEKKRKQTSKQANKQARKQDCKARIESTNKQAKYNQGTAKRQANQRNNPTVTN